jgi:hypothetical protein
VWSYCYYAIALFGAAMTPYEVFFFSSGAVEERWTEKDLNVNRANVFVGFPLGGLLSLAIMSASFLVLGSRSIEVDQLSQVALPVASAVGRLGLAIALIGIFAATFGAALETSLSAGYVVAQYFGWTWGKYLRPREAARFHLVVLLSLAAAVLFGISGIDPVKVTEYSIVLSAAALPLTYFPILVIANDPRYMGDKTNGRLLNGVATAYLVLLGRRGHGDHPPHHRDQGRELMASARVLYAGLDLLDRQLRDRNGRLCGNVDDLELATPEGSSDLLVTAILTGPGMLAYRLGRRRVGRWLERTAHEVRAVDSAGLTRIPMELVHQIGPTLDVAIDAADLANDGTERWVRDHVIGHIPGSRHEPPE